MTPSWEQRKLGDIATIVGGGTPSTNNDAYWDGDIDWYSPAELGEQVYADRSVRRITQAGYDSCSATLLPAGKTILFTSRAGIGNTAILRRSACTNQGFQSLVMNDDIDVYFVYSMTDRIKKFAEQKASGSTFLEISGKGLAAGEFVFPSKDEQTAIGSMFKQLDHLITLHQRKYDKLCAVKKSMLDKMFPKPGEIEPEIRFAGFTDPWEQRKLGDVANIKTGDSDLQDAVPNGLYPFFVRSDKVERSNRYLFDGEAILVPGEGRLGEIFHYINGKFDYHQRVYKISNFVDVDAKFAMYSMMYGFKKHALENTAKATVDSIRLPTLTEFKFRVPCRDEQYQINVFFSRLDNLITLHQRELNLLKNTKKSLLDKMFV